MSIRCICFLFVCLFSIFADADHKSIKNLSNDQGPAYLQTYADNTATKTLTNDQRRAFLQAYSPIILGAAAERKSEHLGHDWITNYYYDDDDFSNNKRNWKEIIKAIKSGRNFDIRPTLYTSIVEFDDEGRKSLVLFYHIYRARDSSHIHDWERVELRLDNVTGDPKSGETVSYVVVTEHSLHKGRLGKNVNYYETASGKHPLIYQADWRNGGSLRKHEIHFVEESAQKIKTLRNSEDASVDVDKVDEASFHYIFVTGNDRQAVKELSARELTLSNATEMYSGARSRSTVRMGNVKRITLELQDVADIFPTHWVDPENPGNTNPGWIGDIKIMMDETPLVRLENDKPEIIIPVSPNLYSFRYKSIEISGDEGKSGYPRSEWFWGTYRLNGESLDNDIIEQREKYLAANRPIPAPSGLFYFWQHDFMVHKVNSSGQVTMEWLPYGWHKAENSGFDGRWVQLFADPQRER